MSADPSAPPPAPPAPPAPPVDVVDGLTRALARACRALADAGRPRDAGRLAADGWVLLRRGHPDQALRLDGTMHHIARIEQQLEKSPTHQRNHL